MLRDVVAAFLDSVTEREFDAPLLALLNARGFDDVHFLHGAFEFGKDFIAKGLKPPNADVGSGDAATWTRHQFALQSKAGNLGLGEWRDVRQQLDEARLDGIAHPSFDTTLPRAGVVVVTGRLTGGAPAQAQSYRDAERSHGRPDFEVWDRETLLRWLVDAPEVGLAGTSDGPMLTLLGAIDAGTVTLPNLERHTRSWLPPDPESIEAAMATAAELDARRRRASVEAAVLVNRLRKSGRIDLAALVALQLLRRAWSAALASGGGSDRPPDATTAVRLFVGCAAELMGQVEPVADNPRALLDASTRTPLAHVGYPVTCLRLAEILGLLDLLVLSLSSGDPVRDIAPASESIQNVVSRMIASQPGCAHPVGDAFGVSLVAPTLSVARHDVAAARNFLTRAAVWLADRYEDARGGIGLAGHAASPDEEVAQLLGGVYEFGPRRRSSSYVATVLTDLSAVIPGCSDLYEDLVNEFAAVDIVPFTSAADESRAQWRADGARTQLTPAIRYAEPFPDDGLAAPHFNDPPPPIPAWDAIALASVARNRHPVAALRAILAGA
jgi:hypothetical protein